MNILKKIKDDDDYSRDMSGVIQGINKSAYNTRKAQKLNDIDIHKMQDEIVLLKRRFFILESTVNTLMKDNL